MKTVKGNPGNVTAADYVILSNEAMVKADMTTLVEAWDNNTLDFHYATTADEVDAIAAAIERFREYITDGW